MPYPNYGNTDTGAGIAGGVTQGAAAGSSFGPIGAGVGAIVGGVGGYLSARSADEASRDLRKQIRAGVGQAQADTVRQTAAYLGSSGFQTANNFIRGLYGLGPESGQEMYSQLLGLYGGNAAGQNAYGGPGGSLAAGAFGYGMKGYGQGGNSIAAQNQAYVLQMLGLNPSGSGLGTVNAADAAARLGLNPVNGPQAGMNISAYAAANPHDLGEGVGARVGTLQAVNDQTNQGSGATPAPNINQGINPLLQNFNQQLTQTLAARGLNQGVGAASTVASGLGAYQTQLQLQNIGQLLNLSATPFTFAEQVGGFGGNANRDVFAATGGQASYGQASPAALNYGGNAGLAGAFQGAVSGAGAGAGLGLDFQTATYGSPQQQQLARQNQQYYMQQQGNQLNQAAFASFGGMIL